MTKNLFCSNCGKPFPVDDNAATPATCTSCQRPSELETQLPISAQAGECNELPTLPPSSTTRKTDPEGREQLETQSSFPNESRHKGLDAYGDCQLLKQDENIRIYKAYDSGLDRYVLLNTFELNPNDASERKAVLARSEVLSRIHHANLPATFEARGDDTKIYVAQELVEGNMIGGFQPRDFKQKCHEGFFPSYDLHKKLRDAASALNGIHQNGLVHGNIKPECLVLEPNGNFRLTGFALFKNFGTPDNDAATGVNVREDIGALARCFYFFVTGEEPMTESNIATNLRKKNRGLSKSFCRILERCITSCDDQIDSCAELVSQAEHLMSVHPIRTPWRIRISSKLLGCFFVLVSFLLSLSFIFGGSETQIPDHMSFVFLVPFVYTIFMESLFGWTAFRRAFGMQLFHVSGEIASNWRRFVRSLVMCSLILFVFVSPALILVASFSFTESLPVAFVSVFAGVFGLIVLIYAPSFFLKSRWTVYDLATEVTWGKSEIQSIPSGSNTSNSLRKNGSQVSREPIRPVGYFDQVDQYDISQSLGEGGMGSVYLAHDRVLQRDVAIKVMADHLLTDDSVLQRFQREARLVAKISHPNVAKVFGNGLWNQSPYIAMEMIRGHDLDQYVKCHGALGVEEVWDYAVQSANALKCADQMGVVHRDIKPANLMLTDDGKIKVMDFGISRQLTSDVNVTQTGQVLGTPAYMAPEQAMGKDVDCRSDIYSLGLTLYFLLTGKAPFSGANQMEVFAKQLNETPPSLVGAAKRPEPGITDAQDALVQRMIAKDPEDRIQNYDELLRELSKVAPGGERLASPFSRILAEATYVVAWVIIFSFLTVAMSILDFALNAGTDGMIVGWLIPVLCILIFVFHIGFVARSGVSAGKKLLGLKIRRIDGRKLGWWRSAVRFFVAYPVAIMLVGRIILNTIQINFTAWPTLVACVFSVNVLMLAISSLMMFLGPRNRALHDIAAGTVVVKNHSYSN